MENKFETEVLTRLAVIESKIDDYKSVKERTDEAFTLSHENKSDIEEIKDKIKWITRTIVAAIIIGVIEIVFIFLKMGIGVK